MCVRCGTGAIAWCTDLMRHGESAEPSPGQSMTAALIEDTLLSTGHMIDPDRARAIETRLRDAGLLVPVIEQPTSGRMSA